jgi:hypothetical protein
MPLHDATWALVREAYCAKVLTVAAILNQFGITQKHLDKRRKAEGWPVRLGIAQRNAASRAATSSPLPDVELPLPTTRQARMRLILRLYKAIDLKLTQMEKHMENPPTQATSTDHERDTRALNSLVRTFDHVTELNADLIRPASKSADHSGSKRASATDSARAAASGHTSAPLAADPAGTERMRLDIAQRLAGILQKQAPPSDAG